MESVLRTALMFLLLLSAVSACGSDDTASDASKETWYCKQSQPGATCFCNKVDDSDKNVDVCSSTECCLRFVSQKTDGTEREECNCYIPGATETCGSIRSTWPDATVVAACPP